MEKKQHSDFRGVPKFLARLGITRGEWQSAAKKDWRKLMSPGYDLRVRVYACLQLHTRGYPAGGGELAITLVKTLPDGRPIYAPLSPTMISAELLKVARAEVRRTTDRPMTDEETAQTRVRPTHMRRMLHDMETQDGCLTTVTITKFLAHDAATRKQGDADLQRLMTEGLSFKQAKEQKLVVEISTLSKRDRKRLAGRSFMYRDDRPATMAALRRRTEEDVTASLSQASKAIHAELDGRAQLAFKFLRAEGINDPVFAAQLAVREDMRLQFDEAQRLEELRCAAITRLKESVHAASEQYKIQRTSVALNPNGKETLIPGLGNATAAVSTPDRRATEKPSTTMGRKAGGVDPRLSPAGPTAPPTARHSQPTPPPPKSPPDAPLVSQPRISKPKTAAELAPVDAALRTVCDPESRAISQLFGFCRDEAPDCTPDEVAFWCHRKIALKRGKPVANWIGYLLTAVPPCFEAPGFAAWRAEQRQFEEAERKQAAMERQPPEPEDTAGQWGRIKAAIRGSVTPEGYDNWLKGTRQEGDITNGTITVAVPDAETRAWLETEYSQVIHAALAGLHLTAVRFVTRGRQQEQAKVGVA